MHDLVRELALDAPAGATLARRPSDDGAMLTLHARLPHPRWLAKLARTPEGCRRLRHEAFALGWLEPWAAPLGVPRVLAWSDAAEECCLVVSGLAGRAPQWRLRGGRLPAGFLAAAQWLRRLQAQVPAPRPQPLAGWLDGLRQDLARHPDGEGFSAALGPQLAGATPPSPAVAIHGDYWSGNLLVGRDDEFGVVDWSGFDSGSALEDALTLLTQGAPREVEAWRRLLFTPGEPQAWLRQWARDSGYEPELARVLFFAWCARRCRWEFGLGLQTRSSEERCDSLRLWTGVLSWLQSQGWPDPFG